MWHIFFPNQCISGDSMPTAISLFTGCGGSDAGLLQAGFTVVMANDVLTYARDLYEANLPETDYRLCDVAEIKSFPRADLLVGCYPCQGFSAGGARDPGAHVNYLYREFDRALRKIKPKAFIVENVAGMVRQDFLYLYSNQIRRFRMAGYRVKTKLIDAREFGVPQERRRLFFVGIRSDFEDDYEFPLATHAFGQRASDGRLRCPTIRDAIDDLPSWPSGEYDEQPFHWYYLSRNRYRGWRQQASTIVANSRHMPLHPVSPRLLRISTDEWRFKSDKPARRFSYREAARLQGFARHLRFPDTMGLRMKYRVVGNAVPPPLFREVAKALPDIW
jgi:DNA (cytosine-5)-methyltransferase 1